MTNKVIATRLTCFALLSLRSRQTLGQIIRDVAAIASMSTSHQMMCLRIRLGDGVKTTKLAAVNCPLDHFQLLGYADFADIGKLLYVLKDQFVKVKSDVITETAERLISRAQDRTRLCNNRPLEPADFSAQIDLATYVATKCDIYICNEIRNDSGSALLIAQRMFFH